MLDNKHNFSRNEAEFRVFSLGGRCVPGGGKVGVVMWGQKLGDSNKLLILNDIDNSQQNSRQSKYLTWALETF